MESNLQAAWEGGRKSAFWPMRKRKNGERANQRERGPRHKNFRSPPNFNGEELLWLTRKQRPYKRQVTPLTLVLMRNAPLLFLGRADRPERM